MMLEVISINYISLFRGFSVKKGFDIVLPRSTPPIRLRRQIYPAFT